MDNAVIHSIAWGAGADAVPTEPLEWDCKALECQGCCWHNMSRAQAAFHSEEFKEGGFFRHKELQRANRFQ